jgi:hypothetical protein
MQAKSGWIQVDTKGLIVVTLFLNVPTSYMALYASLSILGCWVPNKKLLILSTFAGVAMSILRYFLGKFALHSLFYTIFMIFLVRYLTRSKWHYAVFSVLFVSVIVGIGEGLLSFPILSLLGISSREALTSPVAFLIGGWISNTILGVFCLFFYVKRRKKVILDENRP